MFLSFGDEKFRSILAEETAADQPSPYMELCSTFVHFIVLQLGALMLALVARSLDFQFPWPAEYRASVSVLTVVFSGVGYLLFLYSVSSMLAATMSAFQDLLLV
jgi:drug/metabolite transporter (DMT)-like permease